MGAPRSTLARTEVSDELDYRHVVELFPDAVVAARGETIVYVNAAAEALLGWSREQLVGKELVTIIPERLRAAHRTGYAQYRATGIPRLIGRPVRLPALRADGGEIDVELTIGVFSVEHDQLFVASLRDLRDRTELERQLAIGQQLRDVTAAAAEMISRADLDHVARTVTTTLVDKLGAALARMWVTENDDSTLVLRASSGVSTATTESSRATIDVATYPFKVGRVARTLQPLIDNELSGDPEFDQAWLARERIVAVAAFPLRSGDQLRGVIAAFFRARLAPETVDLLETFAAMASAAANDARLFEQLRSAIEARDQFLSMASHELNTPLTTLKLQLESVTRGACSDPTIAPRIERAQKQVSRLASLVRELLDVSRIAGGRLHLRAEEFDLSELVADVVDRHMIDLEVAGCAVQTNLAPEVRGSWDRDRIDQVITNLLGNAIKYGAARPIEIAVEAGAGGVRIVVRDHGIGIRADDRVRIFERFERAVHSPSAPGLGLGLWICSEIVAAHGGRLTVDSEVGSGSTFVVELPLAITASDP
jgi:PAS domain S-box-containing protein